MGRSPMLPTGNERVSPDVTDISSDSQLLSFAAAGQTGVLAQGWARLSAVMAAEKMDRAGKSVTSPRDRYTEEMEPLVRRLTLISVAPPTSRNYDAQVMLGSLASYAFEPMREHL